MSENRSAILGALSFLGAAQPVAQTSNTVPTSKTRSALELLANSTPEGLLESQVNLREVAANLFNWGGGQPKATKTVIKALSEALSTPGKYSHAVELTAYIAALAPLFQPDRLVRLFGAMNEVETAYAPAKYTLQLSHKLKKVFDRYPEDRQEKLAYSLWVESHTGRWWDLTSGKQTANNNDEVKVEEYNAEEYKELLENFSKLKLAWNPRSVHAFKKMQQNEQVREALEAYNDSLLREKTVDPDIAVLASYVTWLKPLERPESPVGSLLENIMQITNEIEYDMPEKPKKFSELFPDIKLYGGTDFPFPGNIQITDGLRLTKTATLEVVKNPIELAANRDYMGNCTWSYKNRMEKGEYVLYRIHDNGHVYNGSVVKGKSEKWSLSELNSRHNRGQVPQNIRDSFNAFISRLPRAEADNQFLVNQKIKNYKFKYKL